MDSPLVSPSILSADFSNLQSEVEMLNGSEADWIHIDVMDGIFVPNISFGLPVCHAINRHAEKPLDVHLMIEKPENYAEAFRDAGAKIISVHHEACPHLHRNLQQLKDLGVKRGVAINPHTSVRLLVDLIEEIDLVCMMSVNPGFGGQSFIDHTYEKISSLKDIISRAGTGTMIEVDGGVNTENARLLVEAGADVLVAGNAVFKSDSPSDTIKILKGVN